MKGRWRVAVLAVTLVACTTAPSGSGSSGSPALHDRQASPFPSDAAQRLAIMPAGYQLTVPIQRAVAVWDSGIVYIAGGLDAAGQTVGGVFSMDPNSGRITPLGSLPQQVHDAAGAMISGKLYVFAGGAGSGTDTVQAFDPSTGKGAVVGHLPVSLSDLAAAQVGDTTYLIGGYDGSKPRTEIYATTDGTTFRVVGHLPVGLRYPAVSTSGGMIVIAGGLASGGPTTGVYAFDPSSAAMRPVGVLPAPVAHAASFSLGGITYVAGGRDASEAAVTRVTSIDPATGMVMRESPLSRPLADAAVVSSPGRALLVGGWGETTLRQVLQAAAGQVTPTSSSQSGSTAGANNVWAAIASGKYRASARGVPSYVYVPNGVPGTVEVIDPKTYKVIRTIHLGPRTFPEHVTPSWNMRWLYVDTSEADELAVIDPRTGKLARIIHGVEHPYNLYFTLDGSMAIDVAEYYDRLDFMDPHTWKRIKSVPMPCNGPDHLDFSADGSYLMISCEYDGTVVKVDVSKMKVLGTIHVGGMPVDVKLSPNGKAFFVANQGMSGVSIVDPVSMKVQGFIHTGDGAHGMAVSRDATHLYVTNRLAGTISVIDFATRTVVSTWNVGGSPDMIQVTPDG